LSEKEWSCDGLAKVKTRKKRAQGIGLELLGLSTRFLNTPGPDNDSDLSSK